MTPDTPGEEAPPTRLERWKGRYDLVSDIFSPKRLGLALAVLALVVVGLVGGWDKVGAKPDPTPPSATPRVPFAAEPFAVTVTTVNHGTELEPIARARADVRYLFVAATVRTTLDRPIEPGYLRTAVHLDAPGVDQTRRLGGGPSVYRVQDGLEQRDLQPGITYDLVFVFEQDAAEAVPQTVTVSLDKQVWQKSNLDGGWDWRDPETAAVLEVPVKPLKGVAG